MRLMGWTLEVPELDAPLLLRPFAFSSHGLSKGYLVKQQPLPSNCWLLSPIQAWVANNLKEAQTSFIPQSGPLCHCCSALWGFRRCPSDFKWSGVIVWVLTWFGRTERGTFPCTWTCFCYGNRRAAGGNVVLVVMIRSRTSDSFRWHLCRDLE